MCTHTPTHGDGEHMYTGQYTCAHTHLRT
jgi:hypothetical protein